jgi:hypothetical protein
LRRCLHAEGKRVTVKCERGTWRGVRPNAQARRSGGYQRGSALHRNDGMKRRSGRHRVVRRRDDGPIVVMGTRVRQVRDASAGRGRVMTRRSARDGIAMRLARSRTLVEHHREYRHGKRHHGRHRNLRRAEHTSILPYTGIRRAVRRFFQAFARSQGRQRRISVTAPADVGGGPGMKPGNRSKPRP